MPTTIASFLRQPLSLAWGFVIIHLVCGIVMLEAFRQGDAYADVSLYRYWAWLAVEKGEWHGITTDSVYPLGSLLPIMLPFALGVPHYQLLWFLMITALNGAALLVLTNRGRNENALWAGWWWLLLNLVLAPVSLLRLEGVSSPLVVMGLVLLVRHTALASVLLAFATWVKVWPAAVVLAVLTASPRRLTVLVWGSITSAVIVGVGLAAGAGKHLLSFVTEQSDRQLQFEAPITTPWVWLNLFHVPGTKSYFNNDIYTQEVTGPGTDLAVRIMTPLMFLVLLLIAVIMLFALFAGANRQDLLLVGALAMVSAFVLFNKVGSPQYMLWITPVVAAGLLRPARLWRTVAALMVVVGVLTTIEFPLFYLEMLSGNMLVTLALTVRNLLLIAVFVLPVRELFRLCMGAQLSDAVVAKTGDAGFQPAQHPPVWEPTMTLAGATTVDRERGSAVAEAAEGAEAAQGAEEAQAAEGAEAAQGAEEAEAVPLTRIPLEVLLAQHRARQAAADAETQPETQPEVEADADAQPEAQHDAQTDAHEQADAHPTPGAQPID